MNKIEEIIDRKLKSFISNEPLYSNSVFTTFQVKDMMKEYAEYYAKVYLEKILEPLWVDDKRNICTTKDSLRNTSLPKHEEL